MASKSKHKVTLIDTPTEPYVEIPRVHPGDQALVDKLMQLPSILNVYRINNG